jgi:SAM-dependent methyltransferase
MTTPDNSPKWPKRRPALTPEQRRIFSDWYAHWLPILNGKFGLVTNFNHSFAARGAVPDLRILELGVGEGHPNGPQCLSGYFALDLVPELAQRAAREYGHNRIVVADAEAGVPFADSSFDRVIAVHVLEHLANLPATIEEVWRVLKPQGRFVVVIPCEGGLAYSLGRNLSVRRIFRRRFGLNSALSYSEMIHWDHINTAREVLGELRTRFLVRHSRFFPLLVPLVDTNLCIGLELSRRF